jgi:hypothetical protein
VTRWILGVLVVALIAVVAIVLAGGDSDTGDASAGTGAGPDPEQMAAFRDCLTEHGAKLPEAPSGAPPAPGESTPPATGLELPAPSGKTRRAMEACGDLAPQPPGGSPAPPIPQD